MRSYVVSNVRFEVPDGFIAGRYKPYLPDPDEPCSGEYLNKAVVVFPFLQLPQPQREQFLDSSALIPNIPERPAGVRLFFSYGKNRLDDGESERDIGGRNVYRSEIHDVWWDGFIRFRVFVLRSKMVDVHVPMGQNERKWYPLISSLTSTSRSP